MTDKRQDAIKKARREAVRAHARAVHLETFQSGVLAARALDPEDPCSDDDVKEHAKIEKEKRSTLTRLAKAQNTTTTKMLAETEDAVVRELDQLRESWEEQLAQCEDMLENPDEYGGMMPDGSPIDPDYLRNVRTTLVATIAHHERVKTEGDSKK